MGWRDVIGAVLDAAEPAPARQGAQGNVSTQHGASAGHMDVKANDAHQQPARRKPPEPGARFKLLRGTPSGGSS